MRYYIIYVDDYSRFTWVFFLKTKSSTEITGVFQSLMAYLHKHFPQWKILRFRCDNGSGEYNNSLFRGILRVTGIVFETAPASTQHKNGITSSERMIRKINTITRAMMIDSHLPLPLWAEAVNTTVYIHNQSPFKTINAIPYTLFNQKEAPLHHLRWFGCLANKLIPEEQQKVKKFGARLKECIMVGYVHDATNILRIFDPENNSVKHISDIIFDETIIVTQPTGTVYKMTNKQTNKLALSMQMNCPIPLLD